MKAPPTRKQRESDGRTSSDCVCAWHWNGSSKLATSDRYAQAELGGTAIERNADELHARTVTMSSSCKLGAGALRVTGLGAGGPADAGAGLVSWNCIQTSTR